MGSLFRSEKMRAAQLFLQPSVAYETIAALGELGLVQFRDVRSVGKLNCLEHSIQEKRKYANEIKRAENMLRQLRFFEKEMGISNIRVSSVPQHDIAVPTLAQYAALETELAGTETQLVEICKHNDKLISLNRQLTEMHALLIQSDVLFATRDGSKQDRRNPYAATTVETNIDRASSRLLHDDAGDDDEQTNHSSSLSVIGGMIPRANVVGFETLIWRACRGNVFLRVASEDTVIKEPVANKNTGITEVKEVVKVAFVAFHQGSALGDRIKRIAEGYEGSLYPLPNTARERATLLTDIKTRMADVETVLGRSDQHRRVTLSGMASRLNSTFTIVTKVMAVYYTLNMFTADITTKMLIGECWYPARDEDLIRSTLLTAAPASLQSKSLPSVLHNIKPTQKLPTYFRTNAFTSGFQTIINAYGIPTYQEANPTPFAIITFPFLFAVMFGDFGHGILMTCAAWALIHYERSLAKYKEGGEMFSMLFSGRYVVLLMGLFSIFTGFVYNDIFSKPMSLFASGWTLPSLHELSADEESVALEPAEHFTRAYPCGVDPMWGLAENKLTFSNSFKMKMAVILGLAQMLFGIVLSYYNHKAFKRTLSIYCEFIPQVIFLLSIFGYLVLMIVFKWSHSAGSFPTSSPPSLLLMLINMFLKFGSPPPYGEVLYGDAEGRIQAGVQSFLVVCAMLCVPVMLLGKPLLLKYNIQFPQLRPVKVHYKKLENAHDDDEDDNILRADGIDTHEDEDDDDDHHAGGDDHGHGSDGKINFGELMVHQSIHTIEFCLGCISNTASYLRLWALSLAHAQLSEVLWSMVLKTSFGDGIMLFVGFAVWAELTVGILLIMEGLSAFLHALRLHWVEFQNKFYDGNGVLFTPLSFRRILENGGSLEA